MPLCACERVHPLEHAPHLHPPTANKQPSLPIHEDLSVAPSKGWGLVSRLMCPVSLNYGTL